MENNSNSKNFDKKDDRDNPTLRRDAMWEQHVRLLATVNGGAIVALLAFIQAIWDKTPELRISVALGIIALSLGLISAVMIPLFRELTVLNWNSKNSRARITQKLYRLFALISISAFIAGVGIVSSGFLQNIN